MLTMPRIPGVARRVPWLILLDAGKVAREHWTNLTPSERSKLGSLDQEVQGPSVEPLGS